jgi:hypothetical protein
MLTLFLPAPQAQLAQAPAQLLVIDQAALQQAQQRPMHPVPPTPRCGGVNATGAWSGGGSRSDPTNPRTTYFLQALQMDPSKAFSQLTAIEKEYCSGLKAKTGPSFVSAPSLMQNMSSQSSTTWMISSSPMVWRAYSKSLMTRLL